MVGLRVGSRTALSRSILLSAVCASFAPTSIGYQDLSALLVRQPAVSEPWRDHLIASPFGTIHAATFRFSRPLGSALSDAAELQPVSFDPTSLDVKVWAAEPSAIRPALQIEYPSVNRRRKGDRLAPPARLRTPENPPQLQPAGESAPSPAHAPPGGVSPPKDADRFAAAAAGSHVAADAFDLLAGYGANGDPPGVPTKENAAVVHNRIIAPAADAAADDSGGAPPEVMASGSHGEAMQAPSPSASLLFSEEDAAESNEQLYFSVAVMGSGDGLQQWAPGAAPVPALADGEQKLATMETPGGGPETNRQGEAETGTNGSRIFRSPAERLELTGKRRATAERCIADAVYFEARGEPLRGQMAVAQVVMNRVFSGRYPMDVCGVVFQNADRHLACQFTFACEGKDLSRIDEPNMWQQAKRIAKDTLDGKIWLPEVGHATHYHAYWVHPSWVHEMVRLYKLGVHTFYRPRAWGSGADAPVWSNVPAPAKPASVSLQTAPDSKAATPAAQDPDRTAQAADRAERGVSPDGATARL
jgi:spore germination cell wall hydrolase CwlJ-like protein